MSYSTVQDFLALLGTGMRTVLIDLAVDSSRYPYALADVMRYTPVFTFTGGYLDMNSGMVSIHTTLTYEAQTYVSYGKVG